MSGDLAIGSGPCAGGTRPGVTVLPRGFWYALGASVLAHAAWLGVSAAPRLFQGESTDAAQVSTVAPLRLRIVGASTVMLPAQAVVATTETRAPAPDPRPAPSEDAAALSPTSAAEIPPSGPVRPDPDSDPASAGVEATPSEQHPPMPPTPPSGTSVDGYVLRKALTVPPVPVSDIHVPWPKGVAGGDRQTGVFSVFIDETGAVRRMVPDGPTLFPVLESAAREVFLAARFEPGQIDGQAVKALIRVEVVFEAAALARAPSGPVIVSRQNL